jgi:lipopolysaccharide transport system permease protein
MSRLIIEAGRTEKNYWADLWKYRELFCILAWRDVAVRYKQTVVGVAWAVLQPLMTLVIFTVIFGVLAKMPSTGTAPYIIMVAAAQLPWQFFANSLSSSSQSLVGNAQLISKVYFPRLIVPAGAVVTALIDFFITFVILVVLMIGFKFWPTWRMLVLPPLVLMAFLASLGPGLLLTALTVKYRDFRIVVPFLVQVGAYVSPVGFSSSIVPEQWRLLYSLNPMVGVIDGFRWAVLAGESPICWPGFGVSLGVTVLLLLVGIWYFRRTERVFADII